MQLKQWSTHSFSVEVPEIYQIEITNSCNLSCPACIRQDARVKRPIGFIDLDLIRTMIARGDFAGSYFSELQAYGEPLLHPQLFDIIKLIKSTGCKVGLSTNGTLLMENMHAVRALDFLTISVDSADEEKYNHLRPGSSFKKLTGSITELLSRPHPVVDLQVINFWDGENELPDLVKLTKRKGWDVTCRAVPDCFAAYQGRPHPEITGLCLNPWLSVSVQWDGDCVACCFSAGKDLVYGNLYQQSLRDIWNISPVRQGLMTKMRTEFNMGGMPCQLCFMRNPVLFHLRMLMQNFKRGQK